MRQLVLMRHAEAETSSLDGDITRALTARGLADAEDMGRTLADRGVRLDLALISSATRAQQTWDAVRGAFGDVVTDISRDFYEADSQTLRRRIEDVEDSCGGLILIGHNPAIHRLGVDLLIEQAAAPSTLERLAGGFPPGSAVTFTTDGSGRLAYDGFYRPGDFG